MAQGSGWSVCSGIFSILSTSADTDYSRLEGMEPMLANDWRPWRSESRLHGRRPNKTDLAETARAGIGLDDVLPYPTDTQNTELLRLLIVGTNPSPWAATVKAPFARPGNRFWASLHAGGVTERLVAPAVGLSHADEHMLAMRGVGITNIVSRPSSRADELSLEELRTGCGQLVERMQVLRPRDRKSTRLNSSHVAISYAVFC